MDEQDLLLGAGLRGGMDASQYKDYVLVLLFMKYVSDKAASQKNYLSVYLGNEDGVAALIAAVSGLKGGKNCLNITDRIPLPMEQLEPVIRRQLAG